MQFKEVSEKIIQFFDKKKVRSVDQVWEKSNDGWKWVLSLHNFFWGTSMIIHTKIILKTDKDKNIKNNWSYLFDLNCVYHHKEFETVEDLLEQIKNIFTNNNFGKNIKSLSDQLKTPVVNLNNKLSEIENNKLSFYEFYYEPQRDIVPCKNQNFRFISDLNDLRDLEYILTLERNWKLDVKWQNRFKYINFDDINSFSDKIIEITLDVMNI